MRQRGFTAIELMIVLAIIGILAALAAPSMVSLMRIQRIRSASFDVVAGLQLARSEAIKRNSSVTIAPVGGDWAAGWVSKDANNNVVQRQDAVVSCSGCVLTGPVSVVYSPSGRLNAGAAPQFAVTYPWGAEDSTIEPRNRCIDVDLSGRPVSKKGNCT